MWREKTVKINNVWIDFCFKVYDEPSIYGINEGKISKLEIRINKEIVANYDRGWDIAPETPLAKQALTYILKQYN